jgi:large repetitive protein
VAVLASVGTASATGEAEPDGSQVDPALVFTGTAYLVAWRDSRIPAGGSLAPQGPPPPPPAPPPPPPPPPPRASLAGARLTPSGKLLDPGGVAIAPTSADIISEPAVASAGATSLVVWAHRAEQTSAIYATRVSSTGSVLAPAEFQLAGMAFPAHYLWSPDVGFDGHNYLVAWTESERNGAPQVVGVRVTPDGTVLDAPRIPIAPGQTPAVAFDGTNYLVVAWDYWPTRSLVATRVTPSGAVLDTTPIVLSSALDSEPTPAVAFNGTNYLVAWVRSEEAARITIRATRVTRDGAVLDPGGLVVAGLAQWSTQHTVASDGAGYLVAWEDQRFGCCSIFGTRVGAAGNVLDPGGIPIATRGREQRRPASGFDGTNYLVAWDDNRRTPTDIYAARVTRLGRVLDPRGTLLSTQPPPPARCVVPRLIGMRLPLAKSRIRHARCSVGRVRRARSARVGKVIGQSPRAGSVRRSGYRVSLRVGRR